MTDFRILKTFGATAAALCLAVPALAQTSDTTGSGSTATAGGATTSADATQSLRMGQRADEVTCAHLSAMDATAMETTLYYIAGYKRGQDDSMNLSGGGAMESSSAAPGTLGSATGAADTSTTASTTGTTAGTVTTDVTSTEGMTGSTDTDTDTDTAMSGETGTETDTTTAMSGGGSLDLSGEDAPDSATASTTAGATAGAGGSAGMSDGSEIDGFFSIPVAQVTVSCLDDPSRSVSDVIDEHRGAANN